MWSPLGVAAPSLRQLRSWNRSRPRMWPLKSLSPETKSRIRHQLWTWTLTCRQRWRQPRHRLRCRLFCQCLRQRRQQRQPQLSAACTTFVFIENVCCNVCGASMFRWQRSRRCSHGHWALFALARLHSLSVCLCRWQRLCRQCCLALPRSFVLGRIDLLKK